jgi:hypothetical protein
MESRQEILQLLGALPIPEEATPALIDRHILVEPAAPIIHILASRIAFILISMNAILTTHVHQSPQTDTHISLWIG